MAQLACTQAFLAVAQETRQANEALAYDPASFMNRFLERRQARREARIVAAVAGPVLVHEIEEEYDLPHEPAEHPLGL